MELGGGGGMRWRGALCGAEVSAQGCGGQEQRGGDGGAGWRSGARVRCKCRRMQCRNGHTFS